MQLWSLEGKIEDAIIWRKNREAMLQAEIRKIQDVQQKLKEKFEKFEAQGEVWEETNCALKFLELNDDNTWDAFLQFLQADPGWLWNECSTVRWM